MTSAFQRRPARFVDGRRTAFVCKRLEEVLAPNEQIDVEPGGWLYKDPTVKMDTNFAKLATGFFGSMNFITNRFTGPGRLGLKSMYVHMGTAE